MPADKKQIGLTPENQEVVDRMMESGYFKEQIDAAKYALSLAINSDVEPGQTHGTGTKWGPGTFDLGGELKVLISALFPDVETPNRAVEHFFNEGLAIIGTRIDKSGSFDLLKELEMDEKGPPDSG